jgi:3-phenylpropionate/trans-cinnamate dioxygenase ferredoxin reductase subunit
MSIDTTVRALVEEFKASGRVVIVGASLAGLRAAETLREEGFRGKLTIVGDEPYEPYDRPPLSKQVLKKVPADHTTLPRRRLTGADWRLVVAAIGLDRAAKQVHLADGEQVRYDLLLIATGVRARPWSSPAEAALDGVFTIRTRDDADRLRERLAAGPRRVLIIGAGFIGSEMASVCRELDLPVTVTERGEAPLVGALGFWSAQFSVNIKSVGVPPFGDEIAFTQGSMEERRFAAAYGHRGRVVAAVTFN